MVNISLWTYYRRPLKEVASMALLMWTVNLMHVLLDERRRRRVVWLTAAAALLATYLTLIRYAAITTRSALRWPPAGVHAAEHSDGDVPS